MRLTCIQMYIKLLGPMPAATSTASPRTPASIISADCTRAARDNAASQVFNDGCDPAPCTAASRPRSARKNIARNIFQQEVSDSRASLDRGKESLGGKQPSCKRGAGTTQTGVCIGFKVAQRRRGRSISVMYGFTGGAKRF